MAWIVAHDDFVVCPVVEGALLRFIVRLGESPATAVTVLEGVRTSPRCRFWTDSLSNLDADLAGLRGYRQMTDRYLVSLAQSHGGLLSTFDAALARSQPASAVLIPPG